MIDKLEIFQYIIIIQYFIVFFIVIFIYFTYGLKNYQKKNKEKKEEKLKKYIHIFLCQKNISYTKTDFTDFPNNLLDLYVFLKVISEFNILYKDKAQWVNFLSELLCNVALPLARIKEKSFMVGNKLLAVQIFSLLPLKQDEKILLSLLSHKNPIIQMHALKALISLCSKEAMITIITNLSKERKLNQSIFLNFFRNSPTEIARIVLNELKNFKDPYKRAICYEILYRCNMANMKRFPTKEDIFSKNLSLRLSAIKFLALCDEKKSIPVLLSLLKDPEWQVRVVTLHALENFKENDITNEIGKCLNDLDWWTRYNAAKLLKKMGVKGLSILENQNKKKDLFAYEVAQFVLQESGN